MSRTRRALVVLVAAVTAVSFGALAPASFGQALSLTGQSLETNPVLGGAGHETTFGPFVCNKDGNTTVSYETRGAAFGPYNGTYEESGSFTIGPQTNTEINSLGVGGITDFQAGFTINSEFPAGIVTGTKQLSPTAPTEPSLAGGVFGRCDPDGSSPPNDVFASMGNHVVYEAQIDATTGSRTDSGTGSVVMASIAIPGLGSITFQELFNSDEPVPPPPTGCPDDDHDGDRGNDHDDDPGDDDDDDGDEDDDDDGDCDDGEEDGDGDGDD